MLLFERKKPDAFKLRVGLGFYCSTSDNRLSTNHRVRLRGLNEEKLMRTFRRNLEDLMKLLELSRSMGLTIFRLGSNFIPFASHPAFNPGWLEIIERILKEKAAVVRSYGIRLTMHPGQHVVLNSPDENVVKRSLAELKYHFWVLDVLEMGSESIVVVHVGGSYGDKRRAVKRLEEVAVNNEWLLRRLALENDERSYTASEVIEIASALGIPAVFDYYHHLLNPSRFDVDELLSTWGGITPEIHISSAPRGHHRFGEHGEYVSIRDFKNLVSLFSEAQTIDVIVEAKKKEKAIARLFRELEKDKMMQSLIIRKQKNKSNLLV